MGLVVLIDCPRCLTHTLSYQGNNVNHGGSARMFGQMGCVNRHSHEGQGPEFPNRILHCGEILLEAMKHCPLPRDVQSPVCIINLPSICSSQCQKTVYPHIVSDIPCHHEWTSVLSAAPFSSLQHPCVYLKLSPILFHAELLRDRQLKEFSLFRGWQWIFNFTNSCTFSWMEHSGSDTDMQGSSTSKSREPLMSLSHY